MATDTSAWQEIIAPTPPPPEAWQLLLGTALALGVLALILWLAWRWWQQPHRRARRALGQVCQQVHSGAITPREGLYAAAACLPVTEPGRAQLSPRFARQVPGREQVLQLLVALRQGLDR